MHEEISMAEIILTEITGQLMTNSELLSALLECLFGLCLCLHLSLFWMICHFLPFPYLLLFVDSKMDSYLICHRKHMKGKLCNLYLPERIIIFCWSLKLSKVWVT